MGRLNKSWKFIIFYFHFFFFFSRNSAEWMRTKLFLKNPIKRKFKWNTFFFFFENSLTDLKKSSEIKLKQHYYN